MDVHSFIHINFESVKEELEKLNCFKSMGPDDIHPKLLESLSEDSGFVDFFYFKLQINIQ